METLNRIYHETFHAENSVYQLFQKTPFEWLDLHLPFSLWVKREDLSPIHSYKWRGAYHCISQKIKKHPNQRIVCASAGNHAQGVVASAQKLKIPSTVFMPENISLLKKLAVQNWGKDFVKIILAGKNYDEAHQASQDYQQKHGGLAVHPYDDPYVIAGQGTIGLEILNQLDQVKPDFVFLQIGGGGMASGVSLVLKKAFPQTKFIGVEAKGQASMQAAFENNRPVQLKDVDSFCDGTSVKKAGKLCYQVLRKTLDDIITVSNQEVGQAVQTLWQENRFLPEPSGALGIAGILKMRNQLQGKKVLAVITGANIDFAKIAQISLQHHMIKKAGKAKLSPLQIIDLSA